jgi:dual specificity tyrosine-phosphorylation-regulated kinase 2/3/4
VFELLDMNLYELIKCQNFKGLDLAVVKKLAIQLLYSLMFLQKYNIIHCDLKPENILLTQEGKTGIKLIDFGSSCFHDQKLYTYIQSRFYRAPEIILGLDYGIEIDMWSFGCVLVELYSGIPIFPGENERDQLYYMIEYFGMPERELLEVAIKRKEFFDDEFKQYSVPNSRGKVRLPNTKSLRKFIKGADNEFVDLIYKCLQYNPKSRIKPSEAILHPWITAGMPKEILSYHKNLLRKNEEEGKKEDLVSRAKKIKENFQNINFTVQFNINIKEKKKDNPTNS